MQRIMSTWWRRLRPWVEGERSGHWSDRKLETYAALATTVPGEFAEIGVAFGSTFKRLVPLARAQGKRAHAFDSFSGMAAPGIHDRQSGGHPQGQFNVGGVNAFQRLMDDARVARDGYDLWAGFIPDCFAAYTGPRQFSFAIVDVDHYAPTRDAFAWIWPLMPPGAVVLADDYAQGWDQESSLAINEFLAMHSDLTVLEVSNSQIVLRKRPAVDSSTGGGTP